jgi:diaminohydroxyphosphoribosylaminopyrimidine deaminase / 5-amino-6-(5-phosphoribosylamino)uracil reductase
MRLKSAKEFMALAIELAKKGIGKTGYNPAVGCVVVKNSKVISTGFHKKFGGQHAEVIALQAAGKRAKGASVFVTLEPCSYYGKTPACTDSIIYSGIKEVFCAGYDPNPLNKGKGVAILRAAGIRVHCGLLRPEAEELNTDFINRMTSERPFVALKLAQSIDGKIATRNKDSKWISSVESRELVQGLRRNYDAIMVGINTVLSDDPRLSIRSSTRQPLKIIIDSDLKMPLDAKALTALSPGTAIIACAKAASKKKEYALQKKGAKIIRVNSSKDGLNLKILMKKLLKIGITSILIEGGSRIAASMLESGLVNKVYFFICPIIIGGRDSISSIAGRGAGLVKEAVKLANIKLKRINKDFLVEADVYRNN